METMASITAPPPPPPPPASKVMLITNDLTHPHANSNHSHLTNGNTSIAAKSQLLIDIEKGVTLKQRSNLVDGQNNIAHNKQSTAAGINNNSNNNSTEDLNPVKNQLHAELHSTLQRRQNGHNKKPNFVIPKNSTINAIYNQLNELNAINSDNSSDNSLSSETTTLARQQKHPPADNDKKPEKLMISHGKPNFIRPTNTFRMPPTIAATNTSAGENNQKTDDITKTIRPLKSIELINENLVTSETKSTDNINTANEATKDEFNGKIHSTMNNGGAPSSVPCSPHSSRKFTSFKPHTDINGGSLPASMVTSPIPARKPTIPITSPPSQKKLSSSPNPLTTNGTPPVKPVNASPLLHRRLANNFTSQTIETAAVATTTIAKQSSALKTIEKFEKKSILAQESTVEQNEIQRKLKSLKNVDQLAEARVEHKEIVSSANQITSTTKSMSQSHLLAPRKVQLFKPQENQPQNPKITSPTIHHLGSSSGPNFNVKDVTSFSKELSAMPNRYPDMVTVIKSSTTSSVSTESFSETFTTTSNRDDSKENIYFSDLKFIINENGEVIQTSASQNRY